MKPIVYFFLLTFIVSLACAGPAVPPPPEANLAASGSSSSATVADPLQAGQRLFEVNCLACHSLEADRSVPGPSVAGLAARSMGTIVDPGYTGQAGTAEEYIRESIIDPNVYIVPEYAANIMVTYEDRLTADEIDALVAYLMTLE